jgi:hypothetical protein
MFQLSKLNSHSKAGCTEYAAVLHTRGHICRASTLLLLLEFGFEQLCTFIWLTDYWYDVLSRVDLENYVKTLANSTMYYYGGDKQNYCKLFCVFLVLPMFLVLLFSRRFFI